MRALKVVTLGLFNFIYFTYARYNACCNWWRNYSGQKSLTEAGKAVGVGCSFSPQFFPRSLLPILSKKACSQAILYEVMRTW